MKNKQKPKKTTTEDPTIQVGCHFKESEIKKMKSDTGATSNATAVAGFVRKRLD